MPGKPYNTNRAIAALIVSTIFYGLFLWLSWSLMNVYLLKPGIRPFRFNYWVLLFPLLLVVEIFIYRWLKGKYIIRRYANLHIISVIVRIIIFPILSGILAFMMITHMRIYEEGIMIRPLNKILIWSGDIIFIVGHIFLILVIIKRNDWPVQEDTGNDHLNEFDR